MKLKLLALFSALLLMTACSKTVEETTESYPDGSPLLVRTFKVRENVKEMIKEVRFYENHQKQYEGEFRNNKKDGRWTVWYNNGKVWSEGDFKNGVAHGERLNYYENGQLHIEGQYTDGKMSGTWITYDENGKVMSETDYDKKK